MDPLHERKQLLDELEGSNKDKLNPDSIRQYLKLERELRTGDAEPVAIFGSHLLRKHKKLLSAEESRRIDSPTGFRLALVWLIYEQVAIACLDCQANRCAQSCISAICAEFPNSVRAKRLKAMLHEATDNLVRAERIYDDILSQDPANDVILKRKVAICKTKGNFIPAIQALVVYLDTFATDKEAWEELAQLYLKVQMYKQAAYCYEELLLLVPSQLTYSLRYADIMYTIGTVESLQTAQAYYSNAIDISQGTCVRALYGLVLSTTHPKIKKVNIL
eukprot:g1323.t1